MGEEHIRISRINSLDDEDAWPTYVIAAQGSDHAPKVHGLCHDGNRWIAVVERLKKLPNATDPSAYKLSTDTKAAIDALLNWESFLKNQAKINWALRRWPDLTLFIEGHLKREDIKPESSRYNIMLRDDCPVFVDAYARILDKSKIEPHHRWAI